MNRIHKMVFVIVGILAVVLLAVTAVTASPSKSNSPLYTLRMEKVSSKMNFLPYALNEFTYTTEKGYALNYDVCLGCDGKMEPLAECTNYETTCNVTCPETCETCPYTCRGYTCDATSCQPTCSETCLESCGGTCEYTCRGTCYEYTCVWSCELKPCDP